MTRFAAVLALVLFATPVSLASAGVSRPTQLPIGRDDSGVEHAIAVNDRGDRVVAYTPGNTLAVAYSRHGSTRFGKPRVIKPGRERDVQDLHVAIAPSGAALVTWRESDGSEYDPTDYRGDVVCCARTMAVVVRPNGTLRDRVAITPSTGGIESTDPAVLSIRDEKHFGVAVAVHRFRPEGLPYEDHYAIYERFSRSNRGWSRAQRAERGYASRPLTLTVTRTGSRLLFARTVSYAHDQALFEDVRRASGKVAAPRNLGVVLAGTEPLTAAADDRGAFVLVCITPPYDHPGVRVVWARPGGLVHERTASAVHDYPEDVVVAMSRNGVGVVAWVDGANVSLADYGNGDLGTFRSVAQRRGEVSNVSLSIASTGRWALADREKRGLRVLLGSSGQAQTRSVTLPATRDAYGFSSGIDAHGVVSESYLFGYDSPRLWVRRVR